jgi:FkbM family methyltransferase
MSAPRINPTPSLPAILYGAGAPPREKVWLFDVGCSGGLDGLWHWFGSSLDGVGFDPLVTEVNRLNAAQDRRIRYEAALVGSADFDSLLPKALRGDPIASRTNMSFPRTSAVAYEQVTGRVFTHSYSDETAPVITDRRIDLDSYAAERQLRCDFLKVDTDGADIEVLHGADKLLSKGVLAVFAECQFHGMPHPHSNTFSNIDSFLRERGFTLFDMDVRRYTRAAMPGRFRFGYPAETVSGAVQWAETLFARDLADPDYERKHGYHPTAEDVLKLATLFDICGLQDCAAELLVARRECVREAVDVDRLLDALSLQEHGRSYATHIAAFRAEPDSLLPAASKPPNSASGLIGRLKRIVRGQ